MRSVTQGDVIRADAKEIPRIFQLLYAGEGEARRPDEQNQMDISQLLTDERPSTIMYKGVYNMLRVMTYFVYTFLLFLSFLGHEFVHITYHMPTACEVCTKPLWHMFKPPAAYECKRLVNIWQFVILF